MKKRDFLPIAIAGIFLMISCSEKEENSEPISADISVSSSESLIVWQDGEDLNQQLASAITYDYGNAVSGKTEREVSVSSDSSQATATVVFKADFQSEYIDPNASNNSVTIALEKEESNTTSVVLKADGPGHTYELITAVLAEKGNPVEVPDCNHEDFGRHIDEVFDSELDANVFRFFIHATPDNDRCQKFDRQRVEIKTYDKSAENLLGVEHETVEYKWKFKLPAGFQSSPNFTHLCQLKSVGGMYESIPMYTLTARKGNPDRLELRYSETEKQVTLAQTELAPLVDTWLEVTQTITYSESGAYEIEIKKVSDQTVLFSYTNEGMINWRPDAIFVRPKWGIYRSLINVQDLRDEMVLFADFSITEIEQ